MAGCVDRIYIEHRGRVGGRFLPVENPGLFVITRRAAVGTISGLILREVRALKKKGFHASYFPGVKREKIPIGGGERFALYWDRQEEFARFQSVSPPRVHPSVQKHGQEGRDAS